MAPSAWSVSPQGQDRQHSASTSRAWNSARFWCEVLAPVSAHMVRPSDWKNSSQIINIFAMGTPLHSFAHGAWQALTGKSTVHYSDLGSFESRDIRTFIAKLKIRHAEFIQAGIKALENRRFPIVCHQVKSQNFQDKWATLISVALEHYLRNLPSPADHPKKDFKDELDDMRQTLDARSPPGTNYQHNSILYLARQLTGQTQLAHASTRASKKSKKTSTENITKRMVQALAILGATGTMLWLAKECYKVKLLPQAQNAAKLELIARAEDERLAKGTVNDVVLPKGYCRRRARVVCLFGDCIGTRPFPWHGKAIWSPSTNGGRACRVAR